MIFGPCQLVSSMSMYLLLQRMELLHAPIELAGLILSPSPSFHQEVIKTLVSHSILVDPLYQRQFQDPNM